MKLKFISFFICLSLILLGCKNEFSSPELEKHFTQSQIEDLNKINTFFISEFLKSTKKNYKDAFLAFKDSLKFNGKFSNNDEILFKKQLKLYNSISNSTFNEIWELNTSEGPRYPNEKYIKAKVYGKYYLFLNEIEDKNEFARTCYSKIEATGEYNPLHLDSYFYYNHDTFDYQNFHNQLILAIYYLTAIDEYERDPNRKKRFEEQLKKMNLDFEQRQ
jgi:hypothetical protein